MKEILEFLTKNKDAITSTGVILGIVGGILVALWGAWKLWIERWLGKRREREGAIVGLVSGQTAPCATAGLKEIYLRHIAHRAGMDYLSRTTPTAPFAMPDSLDSFCNRARQVTSVLDDILRTRFIPPIPPT